MNRTQLTALINDGADRQLSTDEIVDGILALAEGDSTWAKALSHPLRGDILRLMRREGTLSPVAVSRETGEAVGTIAYHFRQLHKLGYIEVCAERQRRGATEHVYRLTQPASHTPNRARPERHPPVEPDARRPPLAPRVAINRTSPGIWNVMLSLLITIAAVAVIVFLVLLLLKVALVLAVVVGVVILVFGFGFGGFRAGRKTA